ncbi:hypothetical protein BpHYR1_021362 [Brachionus plicatilis]|uniref:Uncharacterized protein n=1 Tax=Brachionus plicatilis TaxID=10195 RepID=A0A3M7Q7M1_BRAPC|nr:hypothetical protein BpHYR1_021362 [Brachionus plicatilis]
MFFKSKLFNAIFKSNSTFLIFLSLHAHVTVFLKTKNSPSDGLREKAIIKSSVQISSLNQ